jgi:hypothetical protein
VARVSADIPPKRQTVFVVTSRFLSFMGGWVEVVFNRDDFGVIPQTIVQPTATRLRVNGKGNKYLSACNSIAPWRKQLDHPCPKFARRRRLPEGQMM